MAERMLVALGGRSAWAAATNTVNVSQQNRTTEPTVVQAAITLDFTYPRFRIETTAPGLRLVRVVDGDAHWRLNREGRIEPLPAALLAEDRRWYAGHIYRTIHRIAKRDKTLTLSLGAEQRLEVFENGTRIFWFKLDARSEPYAFGSHNDDSGSLCGPWEHEVGGLRHPVWVSNRDGTWRAMLKSLTVNTSLTDEVFAAPR